MKCHHAFEQHEKGLPFHRLWACSHALVRRSFAATTFFGPCIYGIPRVGFHQMKIRHKIKLYSNSIQIYHARVMDTAIYFFFRALRKTINSNGFCVDQCGHTHSSLFVMKSPERRVLSEFPKTNECSMLVFEVQRQIGLELFDFHCKNKCRLLCAYLGELSLYKMEAPCHINT